MVVWCLLTRPTSGSSGATLDNAYSFMNNLIRRTSGTYGTPMRPGVRIPIYVFEAYDETLKSTAPGYFEKSWGLFTESGQHKYCIDLDGSSPVVCTTPAVAPSLTVSPYNTGIRVTWTAGVPNDCVFSSWDVQVFNLPTGHLTTCTNMNSRTSTSCVITNLTNAVYSVNVREYCTNTRSASAYASVKYTLTSMY